MRKTDVADIVVWEADGERLDGLDLLDLLETERHAESGDVVVQVLSGSMKRRDHDVNRRRRGTKDEGEKENQRPTSTFLPPTIGNTYGALLSR